MSQPKFTLGPWTFHQPWAGFSKITGPNDELIFGIAAGTPEEKQPDEVCEANARLIAAAPELYEALHNTLSLLKAFTTEADDIARVTRQQAETALAKARGEPV